MMARWIRLRLLWGVSVVTIVQFAPASGVAEQLPGDPSAPGVAHRTAPRPDLASARATQLKQEEARCRTQAKTALGRSDVRKLLKPYIVKAIERHVWDGQATDIRWDDLCVDGKPAPSAALPWPDFCRRRTVEEMQVHLGGPVFMILDDQGDWKKKARGRGRFDQGMCRTRSFLSKAGDLVWVRMGEGSTEDKNRLERCDEELEKFQESARCAWDKHRRLELLASTAYKVDVARPQPVPTTTPKPERKAPATFGRGAMIANSTLEFDEGPGNEVTCVGMGRGNRYAVTGSKIATRVWEVQSGRLVRRLPGGTTCTITVDETAVLVDDRRYEIRTGRELGKYPDANLTILSPDGQSVLTSGDDGGATWDLAGTRRGPSIDPGGKIDTLSFSESGKKVVTAVYYRYVPEDQRYAIRLWDVANGALLREWKVWGSGPVPVSKVLLSPDETQVLVAYEKDRDLLLLDVGDNSKIRSVAGSGSADGCEVLSIPGSKPAKFFANGAVRSWNDASEISDLRKLTPGRNCVAYSHDGSLMLIARSGWAEIRNSETGAVVRLFGHSESPFVNRIEVAPDGQRIVAVIADVENSVRGRRLSEWDVRLGRLVHSNRNTDGSSHLELLDAAIYKDSSRIITGGSGGQLQFWQNGEPLEVDRVLPFFTPSDPAPLVEHVAAARAQSVVIASSNTDIGVWNLSTGLRTSTFRRYGVRQVSLISDGTTALINSTEGVETVDAFSGRRKLLFYRDTRTYWERPSISTDGHIVVGTGGGEDGSTAAVWDARWGDKLCELDWRVWGSDPLFTSIAADKRVAVLASKYRIEAYDISPCRFDGSGVVHQLAPLWALKTPVANTAVALAPGGEWLARGSADGVVDILDARTGDWIASLFNMRSDEWVVEGANGHFDASNVERVDYVHAVSDGASKSLSELNPELLEKGLLTKILRRGPSPSP